MAVAVIVAFFVSWLRLYLFIDSTEKSPSKSKIRDLFREGKGDDNCAREYSKPSYYFPFLSGKNLVKLRLRSPSSLGRLVSETERTSSME
ncbi:hypothetical protein C8E01_11119 [Pontibacter virosus]|uniref:Uncharacterized protein n=1 Tax=Pontibacter virosus TaxID=1765052 RepID=A0A2U1ASN3_9BACT|nr:hypothetical protein C8E01_11119 [Pontibacter virosus]